MQAPSPLLPAAAAPKAAMAQTPAAARKVANDFESFFISQSFESMFSSLASDPVFGGGQAETVYRSLLLQEYGKVASRSGGFGVADEVYRQIMQMQERK